jgi:hypothetical protein
VSGTGARRGELSVPHDSIFSAGGFSSKARIFLAREGRAPKSGRELWSAAAGAFRCGLANLDAELEPFAIDARGAPEQELIMRIRSRISAFILGRPERRDRLNAKAFAVLSDRGRWFDEYQGIEELRPQSVK